MYEFFRDPSIYNLVRGPMVWIAFIIFIGGSAYKIRELILLAKKEKLIYPFMNWSGSIRSIIQWVIPFGSFNWRQRWMMTVMTFLFHISLVVTPIFLLSHNILWYESWGITWWTLPEGLADIMTMIVIGTCIFFFLRRIFAPEVRFVTSASDFLILAITFAPFITGFFAYHQLLLPYKTMVIIHMIAGEIMLIAIPFTRLAHMFYFFLTRAYLGSEAAYRHAKAW